MIRFLLIAALLLAPMAPAAEDASSPRFITRAWRRAGRCVPLLLIGAAMGAGGLLVAEKLLKPGAKLEPMEPKEPLQPLEPGGFPEGSAEKRVSDNLFHARERALEMANRYDGRKADISAEPSRPAIRSMLILAGTPEHELDQKTSELISRIEAGGRVDASVIVGQALARQVENWTLKGTPKLDREPRFAPAHQFLKARYPQFDWASVPVFVVTDFVANERTDFSLNFPSARDSISAQLKTPFFDGKRTVQATVYFRGTRQIAETIATSLFEKPQVVVIRNDLYNGDTVLLEASMVRQASYFYHCSKNPALLLHDAQEKDRAIARLEFPALRERWVKEFPAIQATPEYERWRNKRIEVLKQGGDNRTVTELGRHVDDLALENFITEGFELRLKYAGQIEQTSWLDFTTFLVQKYGYSLQQVELFWASYLKKEGTKSLLRSGYDFHPMEKQMLGELYKQAIKKG